MKKHVLFLLVCLVYTFFTIGCGDSKNPSGPGTDYVESLVRTDSKPALARPANIYNYKSLAGNTSLKLPVESSKKVSYSLTVTNVGTTYQDIHIKPESYVLRGSKLAEAEKEYAFLRASAMSTPIRAIDEARLNQLPFELKIRQDFMNSLRAGKDQLHALRASRSQALSDHSNEREGDIVTLNIIGDGWGASYVQRNVKLVKMTEHCKIFIDQDEYNGISAVAGEYIINFSDIEHIAYEFETYIYPMMAESYGSVFDVDSDGRLSVVFSPVYPAIGFAGLFNNYHLNPMKPEGIDNRNLRDMVGIWSPNSRSTGEKWQLDARETLAHEMQHAVLFSSRVYPNGILREGLTDEYIDGGGYEEIWLDEGCSVSAEARYRLRRNEPSVYEARFNSWMDNPSSFRLDQWASFLAHYGQKGLFNFYLYECYGGDKIKSLVTGGGEYLTGRENFEKVYGKKFEELAKNFSIAVMNEAIRVQAAKNGQVIDMSSIPNEYKFKSDTGIKMPLAVQFGFSPPKKMSVPPLGSVYLHIVQPAGFSADEYQFRIESAQGQPIEIMMMRMPD